MSDDIFTGDPFSDDAPILDDPMNVLRNRRREMDEDEWLELQRERAASGLCIECGEQLSWREDGATETCGECLRHQHEDWLFHRGR